MIQWNLGFCILLQRHRSRLVVVLISRLRWLCCQTVSIFSPPRNTPWIRIERQFANAIARPNIQRCYVRNGRTRRVGSVPEFFRRTKSNPSLPSSVVAFQVGRFENVMVAPRIEVNRQRLDEICPFSYSKCGNSVQIRLLLVRSSSAPINLGVCRRTSWWRAWVQRRVLEASWLWGCWSATRALSRNARESCGHEVALRSNVATAFKTNAGISASDLLSARDASVQKHTSGVLPTVVSPIRQIADNTCFRMVASLELTILWSSPRQILFSHIQVYSNWKY